MNVGTTHSARYVLYLVMYPTSRVLAKAGSVRSIDGLMLTLTPSCNDLVYENRDDHVFVFATVLFAS